MVRPIQMTAVMFALTVAALPATALDPKVTNEIEKYSKQFAERNLKSFSLSATATAPGEEKKQEEPTKQ